jgi:LacI family transcriptional regulator/LacI family xylobiose transport system transcriptional regulator
VPSVGATNWNGGLTATRHLLELGHRRIGMIAGPAKMLCSRAREDGYRTALETAGVPVDAHLIRHGDFHVARAYEEGRALLSLPDPPTAIFAGSDLQAFGLYEAARVLGLRVPDDLSVIGFDDLPMARWAWPPLTTIRQPLTEMAATATRIVLGDDTQMRVELATSLVVRQSTVAREP